ncbi:flagellar hook-associated protein 2 [Actimicrobium sp. GrIS 1.19]|uniref:flagellar filament capping protein FliD n=1 Tax=Actimicrobium sp. GrIS 1.19 TaxID=3071708 RepID=UPI002E0B02BB|nr:flagellar hook-associated protein 2 [Actimicrobium sp. GrIS 1.19]
MGISSPGLGSNLDVNSIVSQLIAVDSQPLTILNKREASFNSKLSAIGSVKSALSTFQSAVLALSDSSKFQGVKVNAADATIASATGTSIAVPGTYALEVSQLAQAQKLVSAGRANSTDVIGSGTLTFDLGTISGGTSTGGVYSGATFTSAAGGLKTITIDPSNNTLAGIRDAINTASIGVTATIINDGSATPNRLVLTENSTGIASSLKISVTGDAALSSLLAHDPAGAQSLTENIKAQNALFKVDGISVSKTANTVTDVIPGVSLNLAGKSAAGVTTNVTVSRDSSTIVNSVTQFVAAYNQITQTLSDVSKYDPATKTAAVLNGDSSIRSIQSQIRNVLNTPVGGGNSAFTLLSQVGVSLQKTGQLTLDSTKLQAAVTSNFADIKGLFAAVGKSTDSLVTFSGATSVTKAGAYPVTITQLATHGTAVGVGAVSGSGVGKTTGSAAAGLTIDASNDTLSVLLDGVTTSVSLTQGVYANADDLAANVQAQINAAGAFVTAGSSATVTNNAGVLTIASNASGASAAASVSGGNGKTNLLGANPSVASGTDTVITAGVNDTLAVQLDGVSKTITLGAGNYSLTSLIAELQGKINGATEFSGVGSSVKITQNAGILTATSNNYGSTSGILFGSGTALTTLFGGSATASAGLNVAGTINGATAIGNGQLLTGATGDDSEGLNAIIDGTALGARGTINYSQGYAYQLNVLVTSLLSSNGPVTSRTDGINASIASIEKDKTSLNNKLAANEKRYRAQFTALDQVVSGLTTTSTFLTQQLANLPKN